MARGTKFSSNSRCKCGGYDKTDRTNGQTTESGNQFLRGYCHSPKDTACTGKKSLPHKKLQLDMEGESVKTVFEDVWEKGLKPLGRIVGKKS